MYAIHHQHLLERLAASAVSVSGAPVARRRGSGWAEDGHARGLARTAALRSPGRCGTSGGIGQTCESNE